jgi:hypothetical protein
MSIIDKWLWKELIFLPSLHYLTKKYGLHFNYGTLRTLIPLDTSRNMVTVIKRWI